MLRLLDISLELCRFYKKDFSYETVIKPSKTAFKEFKGVRCLNFLITYYTRIPTNTRYY